jgi:hypothetical protein
VNEQARAKLKEAQRSLCKGAGALETSATINAALESLQHLTDVCGWLLEALDSQCVEVGPQLIRNTNGTPVTAVTGNSARKSIETSLRARRDYSKWQEHDLRRGLADALADGRPTEAGLIRAEIESRGLDIAVPP